MNIVASNGLLIPTAPEIPAIQAGQLGVGKLNKEERVKERVFIEQKKFPERGKTSWPRSAA